MYVGVDVGGSKTLIALFDAKGALLKQQRLKTDPDFEIWLKSLAKTYRGLVGHTKIKAVGLGLPCAVDYTHERLLACSNLAWKLSDLPKRVSEVLKADVKIANDALLGGWAEAKLGAGVNAQTMLYLTISTGIGTSFIAGGRVVPELAQSEGGHIVIQGEHHTFLRLEDLVSGSAVKDRFGQYGYEITEPAIWDQIARDLAVGLFNMITLLNPQLVVIGGGMAMHFEAFRQPLLKYLEQVSPHLYPLPKVVSAKNVETAVVWGSYLLAKSRNRLVPA